MTGQDAVKSAAEFNAQLALDGVIMTKLDGDARGGALLSVKHVTGVPIKFIGTGEQLEALEPFRPEGMAGRILGMGDILALVDQAEQLVDAAEQAKLQAQLEKGQFTLEDFRDQMVKFARPGLMQKMLGLLPGMGQLRELMGNEDASSQIRQIVGVVDSMTPAERRDPKLIDPSRRRRIASGAGVPPQQVSELIKQFDMLKPYMTGMAGMSGGDRMQMMNDLKDRMLDPSAQGPRIKKGTGKRLTAKEREKLRKQREKFLREKKRRNRSQ
jgi:signal recognition particle subunit SRP54